MYSNKLYAFGLQPEQTPHRDAVGRLRSPEAGIVPKHQKNRALVTPKQEKIAVSATETCMLIAPTVEEIRV